MTTLLQNLVDGLGRGSTYALLALGISLIFGVMHLVNFADAELITVGAYVAYGLSTRGFNWWVLAVAIVVSAIAASVTIERVAFRWVRNASPFTMLLTSFAIERLSHAFWQIFAGPKKQTFPGPSWAFNTWTLGSVRFEVMDLLTIAVTIGVLALTALVFRRTLFGIAVRGAAEDFDAARLMGVRANRVISGAFAYAGFLAGVAAVLILMRSPTAEPTLGSDWLLKAVVAAIIGGLGSFSGAVIGGLTLGLAEVFLRTYLPDGTPQRLTDAFVFGLIALLFIVRPAGLFKVTTAERVSDPWWLRLARSTAATAILSIGLFAVAIVYTSTGGSARELLVKELLVNLMLVLGLQVFMGNTGILSFGHLALLQIAAYAVAICVIPVATKAQQLPDLPFGLGDVHLGPLAATLVGVLVALALGAFVGIAVARTGGLAAAMITLAVLFVVDQVVKNWQELTKGAGGLSGVPILAGTVWLWLGAATAMFVAHLFGETRAGRFAVATREDEIAAPSLGIGMFGARLTAWTVSIAVIGLAGALRVQTIGSTNPRQYTLDAAVLVLAMLVVGGMRTVTGAVVGTVIVTVGNETFRQLGDPRRLDIERFPDVFLGAALLLVMLVRPGGLLGDTDLAGWLRRVTRRSRPAAERTLPDRSAALVAEDIEVRFGGFTALDGAGLRVQPGEVVGLIGPNGAGKTTLFNVVTGLVESQSGVVRLGDRDLTHSHPHDVARAGLARTFQNLRLFENLSVRENVTIAALAASRYRRGEPPVDVDGLIAAAGLTEWTDRQARTLDYGNQRRLELARAAALSPEFLLLDEPTSGMSDDESAAMVAQVRTTAASVGAGVLVIDHDLAFITRISDHVVVLSEGVVIAEGTPDEVRRSPAVATAYLGTQS